MGFQVVDGDHRLAERQAQCFGGDKADDETADQARPGGGGDGVEVVECDAGRAHGFADERVQAFDVGARGDLRHDAAEGAVLLPLRAHDARQDLAAAIRTAAHDGRGRFVTARLDAEDQHVGLWWQGGGVGRNGHDRSSRHSLPGSMLSRFLELAAGWIPGASPGMTYGLPGDKQIGFRA